MLALMDTSGRLVSTAKVMLGISHGAVAETRCIENLEPRKFGPMGIPFPGDTTLHPPGCAPKAESLVLEKARKHAYLRRSTPAVVCESGGVRRACAAHRRQSPPRKRVSACVEKRGTEGHAAPTRSRLLCCPDGSTEPEAGPTPQRGRAELGLAPYLTRQEIKQLRDRAASDLRSVNQSVSELVCRHLGKPAVKRRSSQPLGSPTDKRTIFRVTLWLTAAERRELKTQASEDHRPLSGYVAKLIVGELRRGK